MYHIDNKTHEILNDSYLKTIRDKWFGRLSHLYGGEMDEFLQENILNVNGTVEFAVLPGEAYENPEKWVVDSLNRLAERVELLDNDNVFVPICIEYGIYGVHFIDKILGAEVFYQDNQWYNQYLRTPIGSLKYPDLDNNETWQFAKRAALKFIEEDVSLPLFGLPTIASSLNIAVNLYGEEILVAMLTDTENAVRDLKTINRLLCDLHRWYRSIISFQQLQPVISWNRTQPPGYGQLCGCTNQLVSGKTYEELIAPLDEELLSVYPNGGMMHLCGSHTQHINCFRRMKSLRAIQVNDRAAHDLEEYFNGLRDDQIIYLNPCEGMTVEKAMEITGGRRLVIAGEK
jgi:hypothetical protein